MKKIIITGAAGMLGTAIIDRLKNHYDVVATDQLLGFSPPGVCWRQLDLLNTEALSSWIEAEMPAVVIHCAALVNVDSCEKQPALAQAIHEETTKTICGSLKKTGGKLIYISTDSVFNGQKSGSYSEEDKADPPNIYARTKYNGETAALSSGFNTVLRTNIFGWSRAEKVSFAEWVLKGLVSYEKLTMFTDVIYTPIHVSHLAEIIREVIELDLCGTYHATGSTVLSKYEFADKMASIFSLDARSIIPVSVENGNLLANRPKNMALSNSRVNTLMSKKIPGVDEGLTLMKHQYDSGWVGAVKNRRMPAGYRFWEKQT